MCKLGKQQITKRSACFRSAGRHVYTSSAEYNLVLTNLTNRYCTSLKIYSATRVSWRPAGDPAVFLDWRT